MSCKRFNKDNHPVLPVFKFQKSHGNGKDNYEAVLVTAYKNLTGKVTDDEIKEAIRGGKYVTKEEIQKVRSYPIANILGSRGVRNCPFHEDQVPSLSVNHKKNLWRCFAFSRSGNVIQILMEMDQLHNSGQGAVCQVMNIWMNRHPGSIA